ncbi:Ig-like domain-containing protein [Sphingomonas sp. MMS24-JH45]
MPIDGEDGRNLGAEEPAIDPVSFRILDQADVPGWSTTASDGQIEIWSTGYNGVAAYEGNQFFEVNANEAASLYQEFRSVAGSAVDVSFAHRGRTGADTMRLTATDLGADGVFGTADDVVLLTRDVTDDQTAWGVHTATLTGAASGNVIRLDFAAVSEASGDPTIGNFLDAVTVTQADVPLSATRTLAIDVTPVADIAPDSATTPEDMPVVIDALANDGFADPTRAIVSIDGQAIVAGGAAVTVANGAVTLGNDGRLTFAPARDYDGTTSFTYTVAAGGWTETATATVVVTPVEDAPVAAGTARGPHHARSRNAAVLADRGRLHRRRWRRADLCRHRASRRARDRSGDRRDLGDGEPLGEPARWRKLHRHRHCA